MDPEMMGWVGAVAGSVAGVLGGAIGSYYSVRNTAGPRERAFVVRAVVVGWALGIAFVVGLWLLPHPERHWLWLPYAVLLPLGIVAWNRRQAQIRQEESGRAGPPAGGLPE